MILDLIKDCLSPTFNILSLVILKHLLITKTFEEVLHIEIWKTP